MIATSAMVIATSDVVIATSAMVIATIIICGDCIIMCDDCDIICNHWHTKHVIYNMKCTTLQFPAYYVGLNPTFKLRFKFLVLYTLI